jgi:hypothetical protein
MAILERHLVRKKRLHRAVGNCRRWPVPGDYDGDGDTDIAVYRPSNGKWYVKSLAVFHWGAAGDIPVPGDYDGGGVTDIAVWRPANRRWYIKDIDSYYWGMTANIPLVP